MLKIALFILLSLLTLHEAFSQKETEQFIPLGKSPGVSGKTSEIGKVQSVNTEKQLLTIIVNDRVKEIRINKGTKIYIDRSARNESNREGSFKDITSGLAIEVKYSNSKSIDWIKVKVE